jgi:hypothetical protein
VTQAVSLVPQPTHWRLLLQIWPFEHSPLLRQLPVTQVPPWQRWLGPKAVTQAPSPEQGAHMWVVVLQIWPLHWEFWWQLPTTQLPATQIRPVP